MRYIAKKQSVILNPMGSTLKQYAPPLWWGEIICCLAVVIVIRKQILFKAR